MNKILGAALIACGLSLGLAATANADLDEAPPTPDPIDLSSRGTMGDEQMGFSWGGPRPGMGVAVWSGERRTETVGWPLHFSTTTSPDFTRRTITDYAYEGGIEHWVFYDSERLSVHRWNELTPAEGFNREAEVRIGSTQYVCDNDGCQMVP